MQDIRRNLRSHFRNDIACGFHVSTKRWVDNMVYNDTNNKICSMSSQDRETPFLTRERHRQHLSECLQALGEFHGMWRELKITEHALLIGFVDRGSGGNWIGLRVVETSRVKYWSYYGTCGCRRCIRCAVRTILYWKVKHSGEMSLSLIGSRTGQISHGIVLHKTNPSPKTSTEYYENKNDARKSDPTEFVHFLFTSPSKTCRGLDLARKKRSILMLSDLS